MVGILLSYWEGIFSGAMLVSGRVTFSNLKHAMYFAGDFLPTKKQLKPAVPAATTWIPKCPLRRSSKNVLKRMPFFWHFPSSEVYIFIGITVKNDVVPWKTDGWFKWHFLPKWSLFRGHVNFLVSKNNNDHPQLIPWLSLPTAITIL